MSQNSEATFDPEPAQQPIAPQNIDQTHPIEERALTSRNEKFTTQQISQRNTQYKVKKQVKNQGQWGDSQANEIVILEDQEQLPLLNRRKILSSADKTSSKRTDYFEQERLQLQQQSNQKLMDKIMKKIVVKKQKSLSGFKREGKRRETNRSAVVVNPDQSQDMDQTDEMTNNIKQQSQISIENVQRQKSFEHLPIDKIAKLPGKTRREIIQEELSKFAIQKQPMVSKFINTSIGLHQIKQVVSTSVNQSIPIKNPNQIKNNNFTEDSKGTVEVKVLTATDLPDIQQYSKRAYQNEIDSKLMNKDQKQMLGISRSQTKIVTDLSHMYERGKLRKHYVKLTQVHSLPDERRVILQKQGYITGQKSEFLVEISKTKHKYFFTAVKISNPYDFQVIELFRKQGEKLLQHVNQNEILQSLEFVNGKKMVIKELQNILMFAGGGSPRFESSPQEVKSARRTYQVPNELGERANFNLTAAAAGFEGRSARKANNAQQNSSQDKFAIKNDAPRISSVKKNHDFSQEKVGSLQTAPKIKSMMFKMQKEVPNQKISPRRIQVLNPEKRRQHSFDNLATNARQQSQIETSFKKVDEKIPGKSPSKSTSRKSSIEEQPTIRLNQYPPVNSLKKRVRKENKSVIDLNKLIKIKQNGYKGPLFTIKERTSDDYGTFKMREKMASPLKFQQEVKSQQGIQYNEGLQQYDNTPMQSPLKEQQVDEEPNYPNNIR